MRINQFVARASGLSRRVADKAIAQGHVSINGKPAIAGSQVTTTDVVTLNAQKLILPLQPTTLLLHKPVGYVCSRDGQGSKTIYDLLPKEYYNLKPVGRLDKDSSGLLLVTDDGELAHSLTHPKFQKRKIYELTINKPLLLRDFQSITRSGVRLDDGLSRLALKNLDQDKGLAWLVTMHEGRNRQIRRTLVALGYQIKRLHRINFGSYSLKNLPSGKYLKI